MHLRHKGVVYLIEILAEDYAYEWQPKVCGMWLCLLPMGEGSVGIGAKSPLAVIGTKAVLINGRDMSLNQGLDYVATWNSAMLLSDDLKEVASAQLQKRKPSFSKL